MDFTTSMCPECYKAIPAVIDLSDKVYIYKKCDEHGEFRGIVESSAQWYLTCKRLGCTNIYDGYLIDVTGKCNIKCKYCYHERDGKHIDSNIIIEEALTHKELAPFVLVGGEPTLHPELTRICEKLSNAGEVIILTNGIMDEDLLDSLMPYINHDGTIGIGLSFHKESNGADLEFIRLCRIKKLKIGTALWVIDDLDQIPEVIDTFKKNSDVICNMRIKAASNLGVEDKADNKIFVSDMLKFLGSIGNVRLNLESNNKLSFADTTFDGLHTMLVSWYDVWNVDLNDINCPPWYRAKDGNLYNFVTAALINEGYHKRSQNSAGCESRGRVHEAVRG